MRAEKEVTKISRNYLRYLRKMGEIKNSMDRASDLDYAREEVRTEERQRFLEMLDQGLSAEEIRQRL